MALTAGCAAGITLASPAFAGGLALGAGIVCGVFGLFSGWRYAALFAVALTSGFLSAKMHDASAVRLQARFGTVEVRIADANCCRVPDIDPPAVYRAELRENGKRIPVSLMLHGNRKMLPFGAVLRGHGSIVPRREIPRNSFDRYSAARNFAGSVFLRDFTLVGTEPGFFMGKILAARDFLLARVTRFIDSDDERNTVAALLFGVRGGMRGERRQKFVESGTVHLFSVSGMHVSVLAAILLFGLRAFPFKTRYILLTASLGVYTLCTGANPPAQRAFWMIFFWAAGKILLREMPTIELLGIIAFAMLLGNPALLGDIGAQYSFFITAVLLCAGDGVRNTAPDGMLTLMTSGQAHRFRRTQRRRRFLPDALFFCTAAFGAGIGISLLAGYGLRPGAVITNLLFFVAAVPLFCIGAAGCVIPGLGIAAMHAFRFAADWCRACAELFAPLDVGTPETYEVLLFSFVLLIGLATRRFALKIIMAACLLSLITLWFLRGENQPDGVAFFTSGADRVPALVITESRFHRAICINLPEDAAQDALEKHLRSRGISSIDALYLTGNDRRSCGCLTKLDPRYRPRRLFLPDGKKAPQKLMDYLEEYGGRTDLGIAHPGVQPQIGVGKDKLALEYFFPRDNVKMQIEVSDSDAGRRFTGVFNGKKTFDIRTMWTKNPVLKSYDVPKDGEK